MVMCCDITPREAGQEPQEPTQPTVWMGGARNIEACFRIIDWPLPRGRTPSGTRSGEKKHPEYDRAECEPLGVENVRD